MKTALKQILVGLALAGTLAAPALGQVFSIETIGPLTVAPGQNIDLVFPNVFDPLHPKKLTFDGFASSLSTSGQTPLPLVWSFDWLNLSGQIEFSPAQQIVAPPGAPTPIHGEFLIPYCPQEVSIHFGTEDPGGYLVEGKFTHECLIPEPGTWGVLTGLGALSFGLWRKRTAA